MKGTKDALISFQLHNEIFKPVLLPRIKLSETKSEIFEFESRLAIILHSHNEESLSLWTLNDHDDDGCGIGSWTKKLNLEFGFIEMDLPALYMGAGQLVAIDEDIRFIIYDCKERD